MSTLVVIAKECVPGRVKTRLHPAVSLESAARIAAASLEATLQAARAVPADRHVLFFDGAPPASAADFDLLPQPAGTLDERLAFLFDAMTGRTLLIGMDTPHVDPAVLASVFTDDSDADAWFGFALDGGFWSLGMDEPRGDLIRGVGMSLDDTGAQQLSRLLAAGLTVRQLPQLVDVDTIDAACEVAALLPESPFSDAVQTGRAEAFVSMSVA